MISIGEYSSTEGFYRHYFYGNLLWFASPDTSHFWYLHTSRFEQFYLINDMWWSADYMCVINQYETVK